MGESRMKKPRDHLSPTLTIAKTAGALAGLYWDLAEELRAAAIDLAVATNADCELPVVSITRMTEVIKAGLVLSHLSGDRSRT
jgi:hypothetical protein